MNISKANHFRRFQAKRTSPLNSVYFLRMLTPGNIYFRHVFEDDIYLTFESLKSINKWCFEGLGLCSNDFSKRKASDCIYQNPNMVMHTACMLYMYHWYVSSMYLGYVSWRCILAMYLGYVSWLCILAMYLSYVSWLCIMAMYHVYVT